MPKTPYEPTVTDTLTGMNLRALRQRAGETLKQTVERSGFGKDASTLAATERGERLLTDLEATKLAAHFNTTADTIRAKPAPDSDFDANMAPYAKRPALLPNPNWPMPSQSSPEQIGRRDWTPATEQDWLGNPPAPALFAVPDEIQPDTDVAGLRRLADDVFAAEGLKPFNPARYELIDLDNPLTPEQYRATVWYPYLEARYTAETA